MYQDVLYERQPHSREICPCATCDESRSKASGAESTQNQFKDYRDKAEKKLKKLKEKLKAVDDELARFTADAEKKKKQLEGKVASLERDLRESEKAKTGLQHSLGQEYATRKQLQDVVVQWKKHAAESKERHRKTVEDLKARHAEELVEWECKLAEHLRELDHCRRQQLETTEMLQIRSRELHEAQTYLHMSDVRSHGDILRMVEELNSVIFQTAAQITDLFQFDQPVPRCEALSVDYQTVVRFSGPRMANLLATVDHKEDPLIVQTALQAWLSQAATWTITTWDNRFDLIKNRILTDLHGKIVEFESQTVAARWRILTRKYVKVLGEGIDVTEAMAAEVLYTMSAILVVSGARPKGEESDARSALAQKARDIVTLSVQLQHAIGEEISSSEFQIICPAFATPFDEATMEDADANDSCDGAPILCTMELGLNRFEGCGATAESKKQLQVTNVIRAKVAMPSMAEQLTTRAM